MRHGRASKILQVNFKERKLEYTYTHDFQKEEEMKVELCKKLSRCCELMTELYSDDKQFLEWLGRQVKAMTYKIKGN